MEAQEFGAKADNKQRLASKEYQMNKNVEKNRLDAQLYDRINSIQMFEGRRRAAIGAMRDASVFVGAYARAAQSVRHALRQLSSRPLPCRRSSQSEIFPRLTLPASAR
jgi:hypothetical protein